MSLLIDEMIREQIAETQARSIISLIKHGESIEKVSEFFGFTKEQIETVLTGNYGEIIMSQEEYEEYKKNKENDLVKNSITLSQVSDMWNKFRLEKGIKGDSSLIDRRYASEFFGWMEEEWERLIENQS